MAEGKRGTGPVRPAGLGGFPQAAVGPALARRSSAGELWRSGLSPGLRKGFSLESRGFFKWC